MVLSLLVNFCLECTGSAFAIVGCKVSKDQENDFFYI